MFPKVRTYARPDAVSPSSWIVPGCVACTRYSQRSSPSRSIPARISRPADELDVDGGDPPHGALCEPRGAAGVVAHHPRVDKLAAQRLDLDAGSNVLIHDRLLVREICLHPARQDTTPGCDTSGHRGTGQIGARKARTGPRARA